MTRTLLLTSGVPQNLWVEAALTSFYLINLLPTPILDWVTPYRRLYGTPPLYYSLRVFGCSCFPHHGSYVSNKISRSSVNCVFLGYSPHHKGYLNPNTSRVYRSRHILFNENHFPFKALQVQSNSNTEPLEFVTLSTLVPPQSSSTSPSHTGPPESTSSPSLIPSTT